MHNPSEIVRYKVIMYPDNCLCVLDKETKCICSMRCGQKHLDSWLF